jgi:hypothetical protein
MTPSDAQLREFLLEDRADVERHLLGSVENVRSLQLARYLSQESNSRRRRRWMARLAPLGVVLAAGLAAVVLIPDWSRTPHQPGITQPAAPSAAPSVRADPIPIVTLLADVNRGSASPVLHWKADAASIRLQAEVPGPDRNTLHSLAVYDAAGRLLFEAAALPVHTAGHYRFVDAVLPSTVLGPGERSISLRGTDSAAGGPPDQTWHIVGALD